MSLIAGVQLAGTCGGQCSLAGVCSNNITAALPKPSTCADRRTPRRSSPTQTTQALLTSPASLAPKIMKAIVNKINKTFITADTDRASTMNRNAAESEHAAEDVSDMNSQDSNFNNTDSEPDNDDNEPHYDEHDSDSATDYQSGRTTKTTALQVLHAPLRPPMTTSTATRVSTRTRPDFCHFRSQFWRHQRQAWRRARRRVSERVRQQLRHRLSVRRRRQRSSFKRRRMSCTTSRSNRGSPTANPAAQRATHDDPSPSTLTQ